MSRHTASFVGDGAILSAERFDAVLFDLDGVLTETATLHAAAWKRMFDEFLHRRAEASGQTLEPFDIEADYRRYVDGKPRYDGVRSFLASRGIELVEGHANDPPVADTVSGLGNRKNELVVELIETEGVKAFPGSVRLVEDLRRRGIHTAVVSSSANCAVVLRSAGIDHLFDAKVDGIVADELGLLGKPAPDTFFGGCPPSPGCPRAGRCGRGRTRRCRGRSLRRIRSRHRRGPHRPRPSASRPWRRPGCRRPR